MVQKLVLSSLFLISTVLSARALADHGADLDRCDKNDAVCVGRVLLNKIDNLHVSDELVVKFYRDDRCAEYLLASMRFGNDRSENLARCEARSQGIYDYVWGVEYDGSCHNISDTNFLSACKQFI